MYYGYYDYTYIFVIIAFFITMIADMLVKSNYNRYKTIYCKSGLTGREVAKKILDANGLSDIKVVEVAGTLTDHYDPTKRTVSLSTDIYKDSSIASIAVAAHECGHAIQDKVGYTFLRIRHKLVPTVNLCSRLGYVVIFIGIIFGMFELSLVGLLLLSAILIFQLVTLPVEFNASNKAKKELKKLSIVDEDDYSGVSSMLMAAAMTYVASLASTLLQLFRMLLIVFNNRRDD